MSKRPRKREPQQSPVQINDLVTEVIELVDPELRNQSVTVEAELAEDLPSILADPVQVEQVLLNLVRNAMEAMEEVAPERRRLRVVSRRAEEDAGVEVAVIDHGPGIPEHQLAHIFEPFFTTKRRGMGMGLPISLSIAEAHKGWLEAQRAAGGGMAFRFVLPVPADAKAM